MKIYRGFKRVCDIIVSLIALIILLPLFLIIVLAIKMDSRGPVFFAQKRIGRYKKHFMILKFRTMKANTPKDTPTHLLDNPEKWITRVGRFLRKSSLDELPQIINILKGDMSIVGPRPALWNQFDLIHERDKYGVNDLFPGLTGYAQVHGRDQLSIAEKVMMDNYYRKNISLITDIKIFLTTIFSVFRAKDVVEGKHDKNTSSDTCKSEKESTL